MKLYKRQMAVIANCYPNSLRIEKEVAWNYSKKDVG